MGFTSLHFYLGSLAERAAHGECERANVIRGVALFQTGASATRPSEPQRTGITTPTRPPLEAGRGTFASTPTSTTAVVAAAAAAEPGGMPPPPPPQLPAVLEWGKSQIRPLNCQPQVTIDSCTSPLAGKEKEEINKGGDWSVYQSRDGKSYPSLLRARVGMAFSLTSPPPSHLYILEFRSHFQVN